MDNSPLILKPKPPKGVYNYRTFSVRVKAETVDKLDEIASRTGYSRNQLIGIFLDYALEHVKLDK